MDSFATLQAHGFVPLTRRRVALAHFMWHVELEVEQERSLGLVEETVLGMIGAGLGDPDQIAKLMGLDESRIVPTAIANLLRKGALRHDQGVLQISPGGATVLSALAMREATRLEERLIHNPYNDRIVIADTRVHLSESERRTMGIHALPLPRELTRVDLQNRHLDLQVLLDERSKSSPDLKTSRAELLRLLPHGTPHFIWQECDLEVWRHPSEECRWRWRILVDGVEDEFIRARMLELEEEGAEIVPLEATPVQPATTPLDKLLSDLFDTSTVATDAVTAREMAVHGAARIMFVGPIGTLGVCDVPLLDEIALRVETDVERVQLAVDRPAAEKKLPIADPVVALVDRMRVEAPRKVVFRTAPSLGHSILVLGKERAYVTRYRFATIQGPAGRGLWWPDVRLLPTAALPPALDTIRALLESHRR